MQQQSSTDEAARLQALHEYKILDTPPEPAFEDLARLTAQVCGAPIALITLIDEDRQWFKSRIAFGAEETPLDISFCAYTIRESGLFVVEDAAADPRFQSNPFVVSEPFIRFYAGAPLVSSDGHALGALSVMDHAPRTLTSEQREALLALSRQVTGQMELRRYLIQLEQTTAQHEQTEAALRESEENFRALLDHSIDAIGVSVAGKFVYCNSAYVAMFGYDSAEEVIRTPLERRVAPEFRALVLDRWERRWRGEDVPTQYELRGLRKDGTEFDVDLQSVCYRRGELTYNLVILRDITERKRIENALRESEERFRLLMEQGSDIITVLDRTGTILYKSPSTWEWLGYRPEELVGRAVFDYVHPEDLAHVTDVFETCVADPSAAHHKVEFRFHHKNGEWRYLESIGSSRLGQHLNSVIFNSRDVTDRKSAERALQRVHEELETRVLLRTTDLEAANRALQQEIAERQKIETALRTAEEKYHDIFENIAIGVFQTNKEGRFVSANPALARIYGYASPEELIQKTVDIGRSIYYVPGLRKKFVAEMEATGRVANFEMQVRRFDDVVIWVNVNARSVHDSDRRFLYYEGTSEDITARKTLEQEREQMLSEALDRADRDPLTGLFNHRAFQKRLDEEADRAQRGGGTLAIILVDVDNFGCFNDAYGHTIGDSVLLSVANALRTCCRPYDMLARFGGDEFAMLLPGMTAEGLGMFEQRIWEAMETISYSAPGSDAVLPIGLSLGTAVLPDESPTRLDALNIASERLQRAKTGSSGEEVEALRTTLLQAVDGFAMLHALVNSIDNKDRYTRRHSEDVMRYSDQIAKELKLDEAMQHRIQVAALLHDVGKIGVPDHILRKPGKLTDNEYAAMKQHPVIGAIIVGAVPGLKDTLDAVRHHHERWDGQGYPHGLRAEETPLIARLMAVADAYSAMTTDRPYRKGMAPEKACAILAQGRGTQWDPDCVDAFLRARQMSHLVF